MLKYKLISFVDGFYHYELYPEGRVEDKGWIIFNPETRQLKEKNKPNSPFDCIGHFLQDVKEKDGSFKKSGTVVWY